MQTTYAAQTLLSFYQWLDHYLLQNGQMYTNTTSQLYQQSDTRLGNGYTTFAAPFRSFVWDSGVSGAQIFNSVSGTANGVSISLSRGQSGTVTDFENGRAIFPAGTLPANAIVSGSYAFKDFNLYFANQGAERLVFTDKYYLNSRFARPITGIPPPYEFVTPCIFISHTNTRNIQRTFGNNYDTRQEIRLNIMAENLAQLENVFSLIAEAQDLTFPQLPTSAWPLNPLGDYKSGYNYNTAYNQYWAGGNYYSITKVLSTKISDYAKIDEGIFLGEVSLLIENLRTIR